MGVSLRRTMRLRRAVQVFLAGMLATLLLAALVPSPKADAAGYVPFSDNSLWVDGTTTHPAAQGGNTYMFPTTGDVTVEIWGKYEGPWTSNTKYTLWSANGYYLFGKNNNFWFHANDGTDTDTLVPIPSGWFHAAVIFSPTNKTAKLVLNGTSTSWSKTYSAFGYVSMANIGSSFMVSTDPWNGQLDQLKIFSSALTDSQIAQSMTVYGNVGITGTPSLYGHYDMNAIDGVNILKTVVGSAPNTGPASGSVFSTKDIKTVDTTSRPGYTIYSFPRTYLPAEGGWKAPTAASASKYEYLVVAGGGGGGGNRGGGGGAGGLLAGQVSMPYNGVFSIVVGQGGYSGSNGADSKITNIHSSTAILSATGGGAGGTHMGTNANGANGGSGGGASMCYASGPVNPTGGLGTSGQGFDGAGNDSTNCAVATPDNRHTGGGGGSSSAGQQGTGGSISPTTATTPMTRPNGGAGTSSSITGTAKTYAAGGGGAIALQSAGEGYVVSFQGLGGSGIGGDGAAVASRGANATVNTGSGGGGGGYNATATLAAATGGYGSAGVVILVAPSTAYLSTPAAGAILTGPVIVQPTVTVPTGTAAITGCSVFDANGSTAGVSVTCTPVTGSGNRASLTDLTFTSGTALQYYTVVFSVTGYDDIYQEMYLAYQPASVTVAGSGATSNFVWDGSTIMATSAAQAVVVLGSDVTTHLNQASTVISASGAIAVNSSVTGTTLSNDILLKGLTYSQATSTGVTTANAPVTIWATNANAATGTTGVTGVSLGTSATITTGGGAITIGGGANPATSPVTAEKAIAFGTSANLNAGGGNISIRGDAVYNPNLSSTTDNEMWGVKLDKTTVQTVGSGTIMIVGNGQGATNGRLGFGVGFIGTGSSVTAVDGNISITGGNLGSANVNAVYADSSGAIRTTGTGSINITGDGRGTTTTATTLASTTTKNYGVGFAGTLFEVTTVDGNISITGYAGSHAAGTSGSNAVGVWLDSSTFKSTGIGTLTVSGYGGDVGAPATAVAQSSTGVYNSSFLNTTTGAVSLSGLSGSIANTQSANPLEIGLHLKKGSTTAANNPGALQTTSGSITVTGDTSKPEASSTNIIERGIFVETGQFINSTSGNIQVTGTTCSACSAGTDPGFQGFGIDWTAGTNPTWSYIATSGSGTIDMVGRADKMKTTTTPAGSSYGIRFVSDGTSRNTVSADSGAVSLTGSATAAGTASAIGVEFKTAKINTNSGAISVTGNGTTTSTVGYGMNLTTANLTSQTGAVTLSGLNTMTTGGGYGIRGSTVTLSTLSSPISVTGDLAPTTASAGATYYGTYFTSLSATSGNSSTPTTGGQISIVGKSPDFTTGTIYGLAIDNTSTIDSYNADIILTSNTAAAQSVSNPSRAGMWFAGTLTLGASAANLTINNYAGAIGSRQIWLVNAMTFNIGSATSHVNVVVNTNGFSRDQLLTAPTFNVDTDGSFSIIPYATSLFADVHSLQTTTAVMQTLFAPTARVSSITIGKSGNTRPITINKTFPLSTTSGHLKIYGGNIVSTQAISANTLALDSSGTVTLSNVANDFRNVAVRRANATGFSLVNAATSWTAGTYDSIVGVYGVPSTLKASGTPPSTVQMGSTLATYSVIAADGYGDLISAANTRSTDALSVTTSVKSGATTTLGGTTTQTGTAGAAIGFTDLSFSNPGVHTLAFDATGYTQYVSPNVTVSGGTPTLSLSYFSGTNTTNFVSASTTATPTFSSNNTNNAVYSSLTTGVCTVVSGTGVITTKTPGTCTIKVDQTADSVYLAGTLTINITINKTPQGALTITSTSGTYGSVLTLATSGATVGALTYAIDAGSTCTFATANISLNLGAVGSTCMVTATRAGDATYAPVSSVSTSITTNKGTQATLVTPSGATISYLSAGLDLTTLTYSGGSGTGAISFSTSTTGCSINGTVLTSTNQVGGTACSITAVKATDASYNTGSPSVFSVAIAKANQDPITVAVTSATYGQDLALTYSGGSSTGAITFTVVSGACTIAGTTLTPTAATSCVIKVTKALDTNYNVVTSPDTTVTIAKGTQAALTISSTSGPFGSALTLTTTGGSDTGAVTYVVDSGTCSLATASTLNLGAVGDSCMVTATKAATANYNAISSSSTSIATVRANQVALVAPSGVTLTYGDTNGLDLTTLTFTGGSGSGSISFSTATVGCAIASNVLTSTNNAATACVVASTKAGDSSYNVGTAVNLTVTIAKANQAPLVISTTSGTYGTALTLSATGGTDTGAVTYVKDSGTCTLSAGVLTLGDAATSCLVTATKAATTNYNAVSSASTSIATNKATQATLTITSTSGTYNTALTLTTSGGTDTGAVTYVVDSGTCVVNGSTLTLGNAGDSCYVTATKATTTNYLASSSASTSISTNRADQSALVVPNSVTISYGNGNSLNLAGLSITGGSGTGAISFSTSSSGCSVSVATLTTSNTAGNTCTIVTTKAGDANYNASASVNLTVTIIRANQAALVAPTGIELPYADSTGVDLSALTFTGGSGTGTLSFSTVTAGCSITNNILTSTLNASNSCAVSTFKSSDTNYNASSSINLAVSIVRANQAPLIISSTSGTYGFVLPLTTTGGSDTGPVTYTVDSGTCSLSGSGLSLGNAGSSCMVTAGKAGTNNYNPIFSASTSITTLRAAQLPLTIVSTSGTYGQPLTLAASGGSDNGALSFVVDSGTCTLNGSTLTLGDVGSSCMVTATKAQTTNYNARSSVSTSIATVKANQAALTVTSLAATYGATMALTTSGGTSSGAVTFYKFSGTCTVSGAVLTPTGAGTCVVFATMAGGNNYNDATSANATVVIAKANQSALALSMANTVPYLGSLALTTTGGSGTGNVVFSVTAGSACTVTGSTLSPSSVGSDCEVLATKLGDANYNSVDATSQVITTTPIAQTSITFSNAAVMTFGQTLTLNATGGAGTGAISYSVNNAGTTGCSLTGAVVSVTASGTCVVSAVRAASTNYLVSATANQSITVNKATQTITFTSTMPQSPMVGNTYTISATSTSGAPVVFTTASSGCTVSGSTVTFTATGNCRVDANAATTTQYQPATAVNQTINVGQRNQTLTFNAATLAVASKTFGDPAFAAVATSSIAGLSPVYSRGVATTNNACLVSTSGVVTIVAVGVCQIQADQAGDSNTAAANPATLNFNVVADVANAPTIVSVSANDQSITAAFVKPSYTGGVVITGYQLVATHAGGDITYTGCQVVAGNDQACTIGGLTNGTAYTVKVAAISSAGTGLQSAPSVSRVPATNPAAVTAFTAVPDNTTLKLAWGLPVSLGGGVFDSYRIFIKPSTDANYSATYTTVNSQSIFDYTFTNLINGQAYDAMIVTVTTANTMSLVSNTAEVRETPRTVPDAPASILIFEVGSNLVISWTSPVSDGGNAISEYAATISGAPCVLANPTDTTCSITTPTAAGDYPIEVKAKNAAGLGQAVTGIFTKVAAIAPPVVLPPVVSPPSNGGNDSVTPDKPQMKLLSFSVKTFSARGGQVLKVFAENMEGVTEVLVNGIPAKIINRSAAGVEVVMPKHPNGKVTITFVGPNGRLEVPEALTYVGGAVKKITTTFKNYIQEVSVMSAKTKASLKSFVTSRPGLVSVTCVGYQSWSYDTPLDAQVAKDRARTACAFVKSLHPKLKTVIKVARTTLVGPPSRRLVVQFTQTY